jgi:hypothetical protein
MEEEKTMKKYHSEDEFEFLGEMVGERIDEIEKNKNLKYIDINLENGRNFIDYQNFEKDIKIIVAREETSIEIYLLVKFVYHFSAYFSKFISSPIVCKFYCYGENIYIDKVGIVSYICHLFKNYIEPQLCGENVIFGNIRHLETIQSAEFHVDVESKQKIDFEHLEREMNAIVLGGFNE